MSQKLNTCSPPFSFTGRVIIHVGTHKTGSTSIQSYCMDEYASLLEAGCLYPRSGRYSERGALLINHHPLVRSIIGENALTLAEQLEDLGDEIASTNPKVIIISSEVLSREYLSAEPFEVIRRLFPLAQREWLIFLRRQDELLTSRYAEMIKTRSIVWPHGIELVNSPLYLDHRIRLEKLRYAVSDDTIRVLSFDNEKNRLLEAFFETCRLDAPVSTKTYYRNPSLPWGTLHILRITNCLPQFLERYARSIALLFGRKLVKTPASFLVSWGHPLSKRERELIKTRYHDSNRWVESEYFDGHPLLTPAPSTSVRNDQSKRDVSRDHQ